MRTITFFFISLLGSVGNVVYGQYYDVLEAKKSYRENGKKIKKGERVDRTDLVIVRQNGELLLRSRTYVNPHLKQGRYDIDSLMTLDYARHEIHDSLKNVLKSKNLLKCKFRYKVMAVPGSNKPYYADRIQLYNESITTLKKGTTTPLKVKWVNPDTKYEKGYVIIIQDAKTKSFIDILETEEREIDIDFVSYNYPLIQYSIKALDCRGSLTHGLKIVP